MPALSLDELNSVNPEKIYDLPLTMNIDLWNRFNLPIVLPNPVKIAFDENIRENLPRNIKNKKGIYMFVVEPNFPFSPEINYLIYIGRVINNNTFFKRFYEYVKAIGNMNIKRNRQLMANAWYGSTNVYFYDLSEISDNDIADIENQLVNYIIPPLNVQYRIDEAQNTRSLYN
ncbi:hypothetical protein U8527_03450 [Kordia algicida OT-1]|uniref:GIY-YIG domain-containing protein n=1 Tax=Kordia algicida OT-1 TaxID=391587 RepID=A9DP82_9FLAO|nr:hypothetical protein [Kordia algicida]EDP97375.1 hypothetical protein KAOT1_19472 [Kordia algicida OT-1]